MPKLNDDTELSLDLFLSLARAYKYIFDYSKRDIATMGLNPTEFGVLHLLYHEGNQPVQKIGNKIPLASGSITYVVDKLEQKQLIRRVPYPTDRRFTYVSITEQGRMLMQDRFSLHAEAIAEVLKGLTKSEKQILVTLLNKMESVVKENS